ncbi:hypothetical protein [Solirubrobacter soli]|uniref:hypothetical protein n=1 Tax=Solirubrobacter soli TaxID=363832 RepID=UPI000412807F|nr:hypothetical protein [Solirubrobacter soli]
MSEQTATPTLREQADAAAAKLSTVQDAITAITVELEKGEAKGAAKSKLTKALGKLEAEAAALKPTAELFATKSGRKRPAASVASTDGEITCKTCGETQPETKFPTINSASGKRGEECRACQRERRATKAAEREAAAAPKPSARKRAPKAGPAEQRGAATEAPVSAPAAA